MMTAELLREIVDYDPLTGKFRWRDTFAAGLRCGRISPHPKPGDVVCGNQNADGYLTVRLDGRAYYLHRLAWLHVHGEFPAKGMHTDHKNQLRSDNRLSNLRVATFTQNYANGPMRSTNASGFRGVSWHPQSKKWRAEVGKGGKRISCGLFETKEEAARARDTVAAREHGEFATLNYGDRP